MIDTEKLRALLADAAEMGLKLPVESIGIAVRDIERRELCCLYDEPWGALIAAAVNALPELLDAVDRKDAALALAETARASTCAELATAQQAVVDLLSCKHCGGETDGFCDWRCRACERDTPKDGACPGRCIGDGLLQVRQALATAEAERDELRAEVTLTAADVANVRAERLKLARALDRNRVRFERGLSLEPTCDVSGLAARIVAEADAAKGAT